MIDIRHNDKATPAIERMNSAAPRHTDADAEQRADRYRGGLRDATPEGRGEKPGRLKAGWLVANQGRGKRLVHNAVPHLRFVTEGRPAIVAKPGKVLRFVIDGEVLFRKRVGPAAPNPFVERTIAFEQGHDQADADRLAQAIAGEMR